MQPLMNLKKCLLGGALVATGLTTHGAYAQEFDFIESNATAFTEGGGIDTFSGSGMWSVESHYSSSLGVGDAAVWSTPTSLNISAFGWTDAFDPSAEASVISHFTVTSNISATLDYEMTSFGAGFFANLTFTDITTGIELLFVNDNLGSQVFDLLSEHEYQLSSATNDGWATLSIPVPAPASTVVLGLGLSGLLASRRRKN